MASKTAEPNEPALTAFRTAKSEIDRLLTERAAGSADHFQASHEEIDWGHVGTAHDIRDRLQEIASFAAGNG